MAKIENIRNISGRQTPSSAPIMTYLISAGEGTCLAQVALNG
ncbi:MAG: hypothetical protein U9N54_11350 [candidate division Zixibacteria bacterium]|nr:hypothetical protein [candidate division Zixibacteria bacterium]